MSKRVRKIPMSAESREKILRVAEHLKDRELFPEKIAAAKNAVSGLKSLPI